MSEAKLTDSKYVVSEYEWPEYLYSFAENASKKSKDTTKVGAALVHGNTVLLTGYNGPPHGVKDLDYRFQRPEKYRYISHAEAAIISHAARHGIRTDGASLYVTHHPCAGCARTLIQAGIRCVVVGPGQTSMPPEEFEAAAVMFREAGVEVQEAGL